MIIFQNVLYNSILGRHRGGGFDRERDRDHRDGGGRHRDYDDRRYYDREQGWRCMEVRGSRSRK